MKRMISLLIASFFVTSALGSNVQVTLVKPENFYDLKADDSDSIEKLQTRFIEAIKTELSTLVDEKLGSDKTIAVAIYDVDLAGSLNMVSYFGQMKMSRVMSDGNPAKLNVGYIIVDKDGKEIKSGAEILTEKASNYKSPRSNNFAHERKLLRSWLNDQLD